jgi:hypothetical protein
MEFKQFLLSEQKEYLADKIIDVLTGIHELLAAKKQMGAKQMIRSAESVANQIRKILHASWPRSEHKHLKVLQKCGVALMKSIDDKGDLSEIFNSVRVELEKLSHKLGVPANKLGTGSEKNVEKRPDSPPIAEPPQGAPQGAPQPVPQQAMA